MNHNQDHFYSRQPCSFIAFPKGLIELSFLLPTIYILPSLLECGDFIHSPETKYTVHNNDSQNQIPPRQTVAKEDIMPKIYIPCLRLPCRNEAEIAKFCNLWTFWPVIQLINHLFKIRQKTFCQILKRWLID